MIPQPSNKFDDNCCSGIQSGGCGLDGVWEEIRKIKKEVKKKVDKVEFATAMGSKLSLSEISRLQKITTREQSSHEITSRTKQNFATQNIAHSKHSHEDFQKLTLKQQETMNNFENKFTDILFSLDERLISLKRQIPTLSDELNQKVSDLSENLLILDQKLCDKLQKFKEKTLNEQSRRISEMQTLLYKKSDRSEVEKLFALNDLLVIEQQQQKQFVKQMMQESLNRFKSDIKHQINSVEIEMEKVRRALENNEAEIGQMLQQQSEIRKKITERLQMHSEEQQQLVKESYNFLIRKKIDESSQEIRKHLGSHSLQLRQFSTRINVLEHKESQVTRAAMEIDNLKNNIETFRVDLHSINNRTQYLSESSKEYCKVSLGNFTKEIYEKIQRELSESCSMLTNKVLKLIDSTILREEYERDASRSSDKIKRLGEKQLILDHKMEEIRSKMSDSLQNFEEESEKTEERLATLSSTVKQSLQILKEELLDILETKYINDQQLSDIVIKLDQKIYQEQQKVQAEQQRINQVLCSQNIIGKWVWTGGKLKGGNLVEWDNELTNTLPQNFRWSPKEDPVAILIENTGFYRIQMGFFAKKKPTVQLIVNGKTVVSAVNSNSYVVHHSSGRLKEVGGNQIVGLSYVDFIMVRESSRLVVCFGGEIDDNNKGEGFLAIKRL